MKTCLDCSRLVSAERRFPVAPGTTYCPEHKRLYGRYRYLTKTKGRDPIEVLLELGLTEPQARIYIDAHSNNGRGRPRRYLDTLCINGDERPKMADHPYCEECIEFHRGLEALNSPETLRTQVAATIDQKSTA